ncbi:hypothetical protein G7A66_00005 [Altererythrobacter sp. SALINAS58]|uniref:hypothetical protein n=1 Tax=Alteripontixanthobacter muriae TaxID=2705546 RepID=UPI00157731EE|nr:hypothetical protein [Alteripontixanthobacter muriae]NTZ41500.1 hypothetical protein [Alteripontixanthobacter muriae]
MNARISSWLDFLLKGGVVLLVLNEIRGLVLAVPVIYALWQSGGTLMAWWIAFCSLGGIVLSVAVPVYGTRWARKRFNQSQAA